MMKKLLSILLIMTMSVASAGCGKTAEAPPGSTAGPVTEEGSADAGDAAGGASVSDPETPAADAPDPQDPRGDSEGGIDVDLTQLSTTMVYSQVCVMTMTPEEYVGQKVRMRGQFAVLKDEQNRNYTYAIVADETACCQQGLEFVWDGHPYPDGAYPPEGSEITVTGVFEVYNEGGMDYCRLSSAVVEV